MADLAVSRETAQAAGVSRETPHRRAGCARPPRSPRRHRGLRRRDHSAGPGRRALGAGPHGRAAPRARRASSRARPGCSWWRTRRAGSARPRRPSTSPRRWPSSGSGCWSSTSTRRATPRPRWASSTTAACPRRTTCWSTASRSPTSCPERRTCRACGSCPATIDLAGAEIELVSVVARESRLQQGDLAGHPLDRHGRGGGRGPLRLRPRRLPALAGAAHPQRAGRRAGDADPDPGGVLRARGPRPAARDRGDGAQAPQPRLVVSTILLTMYDARTRLAAGVAERGARALRRPGAEDGDPPLGPGVGGAVVRPDRDDLRSGVAGRAQLPRGGPRDRHQGSTAR